MSLMQEDYQLEQKQNLLEAEIQKLREKQNLLNLKDQQQAKAWQAFMEDFEALKSEKQVVIDKDIDLEKKSKELKSRIRSYCVAVCEFVAWEDFELRNKLEAYACIVWEWVSV